MYYRATPTTDKLVLAAASATTDALCLKCWGAGAFIYHAAAATAIAALQRRRVGVSVQWTVINYAGLQQSKHT